MAVNKSRDPGLYKYSVEEVLNKHQGIVVRVKPTCLTSYTYDSGYIGNVVFDSTEIPNVVPVKGGTSKITTLSWVAYDGVGGSALNQMHLVFTQKKATVGDLDTIINMSDADIKSSKFLGRDLAIFSVGSFKGGTTCISNPGSEPVAGNEIHVGTNKLATYGSRIVLQAESDSRSVYFHGVAFGVAGSEEEGLYDFASTSPYEFIFGIEYSNGIGGARGIHGHRY
jgi:hypothetical protein